jgi:L-threonylcarbamoyladenylate synthase
MQTLPVSPSRVDETSLAMAAEVLAAGGVVAFPTETAYGLAADPRSPAAIAKVYAIKGRDLGKPLPLIAADADAARRVVRLSPRLQAAADAHWPGPLTVVAPLRWPARWRYRHLDHDGTAAVRVSPASWATALAVACGGLVTSTSANMSGRPSLYSGDAVADEFAGFGVEPDLVLDAGTLPERAPSTIVVERDGQLLVLRQGAITLHP